MRREHVKNEGRFHAPLAALCESIASVSTEDLTVDSEMTHHSRIRVCIDEIEAICGRVVSPFDVFDDFVLVEAIFLEKYLNDNQGSAANAAAPVQKNVATLIRTVSEVNNLITAQNHSPKI